MMRNSIGGSFEQNKNIVASSEYAKSFQLPHCLIPGITKTDHAYDNCSSEYFQPVPWISTLPLPINCPQYAPNRQTDLCNELVVQKKEHLKILNSMRKNYQRCENSKELKKLKKNGANKLHTGYVYKFARQLEMDPDPYFIGEYNWYFTGGNMKVINLNGNDVLVHLTGQMDKLMFSQINIDPKQLYLTTTLDELTSISNALEKNKIIYELRHSKLNQTILTRQKHTTSIISLNKSKKLNQIHSLEYAFTSADCQDSTNKVITSDVNRTIKIWDEFSSYKKCINEGIISVDENMKSSMDNWNCVRDCQNALFCYSDRQYIRLFDSRMPIELNENSFTININDYTNNCDYITNVEPSMNSDFLYITTKHTLTAIDLRRGSSSVGNSNILQWTHQFSGAPTMIDIMPELNKDNGETIVIGCHETGDVRICETNLLDGHLYSPYLPYRPKPIADSYFIARCFTKCIDPISNIENRIKSCNTGMNLLQKNGNTYFLVQNSLGDVFVQEFYRKLEDYTFGDSIKIENINDKVADEMDKWDEQIKSLKGPAYSITDIVTFKPMADVLRNNLDIEYNTITDEPQPIKREPKWKQSFKKMNTYVDALANGMLSVWNIDDKFEEQQNNILSNIEEKQFKDKVNDWLMIELNETKIDTTLVSSMFDESKVSEINTQISKIVNVPKKKKFVTGF